MGLWQMKEHKSPRQRQRPCRFSGKNLSFENGKSWPALSNASQSEIATFQGLGADYEYIQKHPYVEDKPSPKPMKEK
jgi:hypothetical protein